MIINTRLLPHKSGRQADMYYIQKWVIIVIIILYIKRYDVFNHGERAVIIINVFVLLYIHRDTGFWSLTRHGVG